MLTLKGVEKGGGVAEISNPPSLGWLLELGNTCVQWRTLVSPPQAGLVPLNSFRAELYPSSGISRGLIPSFPVRGSSKPLDHNPTYYLGHMIRKYKFFLLNGRYKGAIIQA